MTRSMLESGQSAAVILTAALMLAACGGGAGVSSTNSTTPPPVVETTTPTDVVATPWPHTALVSFDAPTETSGRTVSDYVVSGTGGGSFVTGTGTQSPIMVQGVGATWNPSVAYAFQVVANYTDGTSSQPSPASAAVTQAGGAGPSTSPNVYVGGVFYWEGDFSFSGTVSYADTTGDPESDTAGPGPYDVMWTSSGGGGGWQPYTPDENFDLTPYSYLQMDLKPTTANKTWVVYFEKVGDVTVGAQVTLPSDANGTYGPAPVVGQWATYKIPLQNMNVGPLTANPVILKFAIGDGAPTPTNVWYANNVLFTSD